MKAVLDSRPSSGYLDSTERYHFPERYLRTALDAVGDWAVYLSRGARVAELRMSQLHG